MQLKLSKKTIILLLTASILCAMFTGCIDQTPQPEETISMLQGAINNFDVDRFLMCIDHEWAGQIESFLALPLLTDRLSIDGFINLVKTVLPILPFVTDGTIDPNEFPQVEFTILNTEISDGCATVALSGVLAWGNSIKPFAATVDMKLENGMWVITGIR